MGIVAWEKILLGLLIRRMKREGGFGAKDRVGRYRSRFDYGFAVVSIALHGGAIAKGKVTRSTEEHCTRWVLRQIVEMSRSHRALFE